MVRVLNIGILLSFLVCYLEWGKDQSGFFFQMEYDMLTSKVTSDSLTHPLIFIPFIGQLLLIYTAFQRNPTLKIMFLGISLLSVLVLVVLLVGILASNVRIIASTVPFITLTVLFFLIRKRDAQARSRFK